HEQNLPAACCFSHQGDPLGLGTIYSRQITHRRQLPTRRACAGQAIDSVPEIEPIGDITFADCPSEQQETVGYRCHIANAAATQVDELELILVRPVKTK